MPTTRRESPIAWFRASGRHALALGVGDPPVPVFTPDMAPDFAHGRPFRRLGSRVPQWTIVQLRSASCYVEPRPARASDARRHDQENFMITLESGMDIHRPVES